MLELEIHFLVLYFIVRTSPSQAFLRTYHGHVLLAASDDDGGVASADGLIGERYGPQSRATHLIDAPRGHRVWQAGLNARLTRRVLALTYSAPNGGVGHIKRRILNTTVGY